MGNSVSAMATYSHFFSCFLNSFTSQVKFQEIFFFFFLFHDKWGVWINKFSFNGKYSHFLEF